MKLNELRVKKMFITGKRQTSRENVSEMIKLSHCSSSYSFLLLRPSHCKFKFENAELQSSCAVERKTVRSMALAASPEMAKHKRTFNTFISNGFSKKSTFHFFAYFHQSKKLETLSSRPQKGADHLRFQIERDDLMRFENLRRLVWLKLNFPRED